MGFSQVLISLPSWSIDEVSIISGDIDATRRLSLEKHRRGLCGDGEDCWQCQVAKMQNDSDSGVRMLAAAALGNIGDPAAIPALVETMQNDSNLCESSPD